MQKAELERELEASRAALSRMRESRDLWREEARRLSKILQQVEDDWDEALREAAEEAER